MRPLRGAGQKTYSIRAAPLLRLHVLLAVINPFKPA